MEHPMVMGEELYHLKMGKLNERVNLAENLRIY